MGFIQLHPGDVYRTDHLAMAGLSALRRDVLKAMHRLEIERTNVRGARIADRPIADISPIVRPCLQGAYGAPSVSLPVQRTPGRIRRSAAGRCVCGCLSTTDARGCLRRAGRTADTVDLDTRIEYISPALASSVSWWSSGRKAWTTRYRYDARAATILCYRTRISVRSKYAKLL